MIVDGVERRLPWLFGGRSSRAASVLWHVWPALYHRLAARRFAAELGRDGS